MYIGTSLLCHAWVAANAVPFFSIRYPNVPFRVPDTTSRSPATTGVTMFSFNSSGKGICQSCLPVATSTPTTALSVIVISCRVPPKVATIGDA